MSNIQSNSFLYGGLNQKVANIQYKGATTDTTTTHVDNVNNIISVDAKIDTHAIESELAKIKAECQVIKAEYEYVKQSIGELQETDAELSRSILSVDTRITATETKLDTKITKTKAYLEKKIDDVVITVEETIQPKLDALEAKIENVEQSLTSQLAETKEDLEGQISDISTAVAELKEELQTLISEEIGKIKTDLAALEQKINEEISRQIEEVTDRVEDVEGRTTSLESTVGGFDGRIRTVENNLVETKASVAKKAEAMYYDSSGVLDPSGEGKNYWYMASDINDIPNSLLTTKEGKYVAYNFGSGGGGGGGVITTVVNIDKVDWPAAVAQTNPCVITVNWSSTRDGKPTGNGSLAVYVNEVAVMSKRNVPQGNVDLDITEFVDSGENFIEVRVVDSYSNMNKVNGQIDIIEVRLESQFNSNNVFSNFIPYSCIPVGNVDKIVYFIVDGVEHGHVEVDKQSSGQELIYNISNLSHGSHSLSVYFTCNINGNLVYSNELYYDLMFEVAGFSDPIITSEFKDLTQEQHIAFTIPYRVYTPNSPGGSDVILKANGETISHLTDVPFDTQQWEYRPLTIGSLMLEIVSGTTVKRFTITVTETDVDVQAVTQNLALYLNATSRSNSEDPEKRKQWTFTDTRGSTPKVIAADLQNFNFTSDGWIQDTAGNTVLRVAGNARVTIPYKPFETEFKTTGKTIEIEFATRQVMDYDTSIMSCISLNFGREVGFNITPQNTYFNSMEESISTQYKEDEHIRLTYVIQKDTGNRFIQMYINGIMCGIVRYSSTDAFKQENPEAIHIGSDKATIDIYNIRIYDNNLTPKQIVNNWIADTQLGQLKKERFIRNDNYNSSGQLVTSKLPAGLPYIIVTGDRLSDGKDDKVTVDTKYVNPVDDTLNYTSNGSKLYVQGTSSAGYYRKNYRINYKDSGFIQNAQLNKNYAFRSGSIPTNLFTYKADVASSEAANNVELVRLYEDASIVDTPAKKLDSRVRMGIDGIPSIMFFNDKTKGTTTLYSKVNFNNDKSNDSVYGFIDGDESWEFRNNNTSYVLFQDDPNHTWDELTWDEEEKKMVQNWQRSFEARYPKDNVDTTKLKAMIDWVISTRRLPTDTEEQKAAKLAKFKAELQNYFNLQSTLYYYLFTEIFLLVDSRAKNAFPTYYKSREPGDGGDRWFWIPYDMDTAIGTNNEGALVFEYSLIDTDKKEGSWVFNCQDSTMWDNVRDCYQIELKEMYQTLRSNKMIDYDFVENRFEEHQGMWSENIFNEDTQVKYIEPLELLGNDTYLKMAQGSKEQQRKFWLYNRFKYMDSKYNSSSAFDDKIQFRYYGTSDITITPYADVYASVKFADGNFVSERAYKNVPVVLHNPLSAPLDTECYIYSASQLKSLGNLAPLGVDAVDLTNATRLQYVQLGDSVGNPNLGKATGAGRAITLGNNTMVTYFNVMNCPNLKESVDLSKCVGLEEAYFNNTKIPSVQLPNGGVLKHLHLPATIKSLEIRNQPLLEDLVIEAIQDVTLSRLWLENVSGDLYSAKEFVSRMPDNARIRLIGIKENYSTIREIEQLYDEFDRLSGLDARGYEVSQAQVSGTIRLSTQISYSQIEQFKSRYPGIDITSPRVPCTVTFWNGSDKYSEQVVYLGESATKPVPDPTKPASEREEYTFKGWDKPFNNVQSDLDINAVYETSTRYYTVKFDVQTDIIPPERRPQPQILQYEQRVTKPSPDPSIGPSTQFTGWYIEPNCINLFPFDDEELSKVRTSFTLYAGWQDTTVPSVKLEIVDHKTFRYKLQDNLGITAFKIVKDTAFTPPEFVVPPTDWNYITPTSTVIAEFEVTEGARYYVWAKDAVSVTLSSHIVKNYIDAYNIKKIPAKGADIVFESDYGQIGNVALEGVLATASMTVDPHYHNPKLFYNGEEIESGTVCLVEEDITFTTTCQAQQYRVQFENNGLGFKPDDQVVDYDTKIVDPDEPYEESEEKIVEGWYTTSTFDDGTRWSFQEHKVTKDMTLYAKWITYGGFSTIVINVTANQQIDCNFIQLSSNVVKVNWGDGSAESKSPNVGAISLSHIYRTAGQYSVLITCTGGTHTLGGGSLDYPVIKPSDTIKSASFALNMQYTSDYAFANATNLERVTLTEYMTSIASGTFMNCINLTSIELPSSIKVIGMNAFDGCTGFNGMFNIPYAVTQIRTSAFNNCSNIIAFNIPDTLTVFEAGVFAGCSSLLTLAIPSKVETLPDNLFLNCSGMEYINIPSTVKTFGESVFQGCSNLDKVKLLGSSLTVGRNCFSGCLKILTGGPVTQQTDPIHYNIEYSFTEKIPDYMFECWNSANSRMTSFVVKQGIKEIGNSAFANTALQSVDIPYGVKKIGNNAFSGCIGLTQIEIPASVRVLGENCFTLCVNLTTVTIPQWIPEEGEESLQQTIGKNAFMNCQRLTLVKVYALSSEYKVNEQANSWFYLCPSSTLLKIRSTTTQPELAFGTKWNAYNLGDEAFLVIDPSL